jgi:hypothetical protein
MAHWRASADSLIVANLLTSTSSGIAMMLTSLHNSGVDPLEPAKQGEKVNQLVPRNTIEDLLYFLRACLHCGATL